jgi:RNA polymerase sigma-70 factor, ECF subfamily
VSPSVDFGFEISERQLVTAPAVTEISEDAQLVDAARDGDRGAFGQLYDRYARMVHGILLARVPRDDVDDLVHDVFLLALRRLAALRDAAAFGGWLAAIARNRAHDYYRRSEGAVWFGEDSAQDAVEDVADAMGAAGTSSSRTEAVVALAAIRTLPDAYRETLILRLVEGMTGPEIAARTGLTPGSVRVNLCRGMQQLREKLGIRLGEAGSPEEEAR